MTAEQVPDLGLGRAHPARMYDYYLGGKDNYEADREAAEKVIEAFPTAPAAARVNRAFMRRAVRWLAGEAGLRQFLDIGTGIPTEPNLHQVAQQAAPDCRVVYADNDPIVLAHAQALMVSSPEGRTAYLHADVTEPQTILDAPELHATLDLSRPVALSLVALLHFIPDEQDAYGIVARLLSSLPSGSALVVSHLTADFDAAAVHKTVEIYRRRGIDLQARTKSEVAKFFAGLELVDPGIELLHRWRAGEAAFDGSGLDPELVEQAGSGGWVGVGIKA